MNNNMIQTYEWDDVKLYGEFQALKNQLVHTNAPSDSTRENTPQYIYTHIR